MQMLSRNGAQYRTVLLDRPTAERFCRCLRANAAFDGAIVTESNQAKHPVRRWMVVYHPANGTRRQELLDGHQQARRDRAAAQEPWYAAVLVWAGSGFAMRLKNLKSGREYDITLNAALEPVDCTCPDHTGCTRAAGIECKHHEIVRLKLISGQFESEDPTEDPYGPEVDEGGRECSEEQEQDEWHALIEQERRAEEDHARAEAAERFSRDWPEGN